MTIDELENYEPKGQLEGFPKEVIARMLECQEEQGSPKNISVFEKDRTAGETKKGFVWCDTKEGYDFWNEVIRYKNFDLFFEKYPKQDNQEENKEFKIGDKVINIITGQIGVVSKINILKNELAVLINTNENIYIYYTLDGKFNNTDKYPRLLHYRDDYDYSVIDFNNLPKRQYKRWRAEKEEYYYFIRRDDYDSKLDRVCKTIDYYSYISNEQYKIGNYFQTREEAQKIVDKTKKYFQELIKI